MSRSRSSLDRAPIVRLVNSLSSLPWWACLIAAALSWAGLRVLAQRAGPQAAALANASDMGVGVKQALLLVVASVAAVMVYVVPTLLLAAALVSAYKRHRRRGLMHDALALAPGRSLETIDWSNFELLVGEALRRQGYVVREHGGGSADGGVDLMIERDTKRYAVQIKAWRASKVGVAVVRELCGVVASRGLAGGIVVASGSFTREAKRFADQAGVRLIDGRQLESMMRGTGAGKLLADVRPMATDRPQDAVSPALAEASTGEGSVRAARRGAAPRCPDCRKAMVLRRASASARPFWGCSGYPLCRGTRHAH